MKKKIKIGLIITIALFAIGLISIKKGSKTNVTLVGMIHNAKNMADVLNICESRSFLEAEAACKEASPSNDEEITNLCTLRFDNNMTRFTNKCLRYYKLVERVRQSQNKVSEFLKSTNHDHLIFESLAPVKIPNFDSTLKYCEDSIMRPVCLLEISSFFIDGWFKEKYVDYLFEERYLQHFLKDHPDLEKDIVICKDYKTADKCKVMNEFIQLYLKAAHYYLSRSHGRNVVLIIGQEYMNYVSCKNFDKNRYNCQDILL